MNINIKNFGKIKSANINIGGLSIIVGKNDSGKSTIGKSIYALKKSITEYKSLSEENISIFVNNQIFLNIMPKLQLFSKFGELLFTNGVKITDTSINYEEKLNIIDDIAKKIKQNLKSNNKNDIEFIINRTKEIRKKINEIKKNNNNIIEYVMNNIVFSNIFKGMLNNSVHINDESNIAITYNKEKIISLKIKNNKISIDDKNSNESMYDADINQVIFIDTPLILDKDSLNFNDMSFSYERTGTLYRNDIKKLLKKNIIKNYLESEEELLKKFKEILLGEFYIDDKTNNYLYKVNKDAVALEIENIAMGVKVIGILYLLLRNMSITPTSLIVLDEPENHLHPSWIIKLADILCFMVSKGFKILLTTHNVDFIKSLDYFSEKYKLGATKFYLCKNSTKLNYIDIEDKTNQLDEIYENLSNDINKIFFKSMEESIFTSKKKNVK